MFKRWWNNIKAWLGFESEQNIPAAPPIAVVETYPQTVVDRFIDSTRADAPDIAVRMGKELLAQGVNPSYFQEFCHSFALGVQYVQERFGTMPQAILLTDKDTTSPWYNIDSQTIFIPRKLIAETVKDGLVRQSKTEPLVLPYDQMAAMYGVEEAFHHYQVTQHSGHYDLNNIPKPDGTARYDENPIERDAKAIVREALRDFNLLDSQVASENVNPKDLEWLEAARAAQWQNKVKPAPLAHAPALSYDL